MNRPLLGERRGETSPDQASSRVKNLIHRLIKQLSDEPPPIAQSRRENAKEVLLDVEIDGIRCVFFRLPPNAPSPRVALSPREREIARMVAKGYPNKAIAGVLEISCWTVGSYLRRIFAKLSVCSRAAMVARLLEDGLLGKSPGPLEKAGSG